MNYRKNTEQKVTDLYADIINLPHYEPKNHSRMSLYKRAAQFAPFSALTGYGEAVEEAARFTETSVELSEDQTEQLDQELARLQFHMADQPEIQVTWFNPDQRKEGGTYLTAVRRVRKIDEQKGRMLLEDGREIPIRYITDIRVNV